jgi:hypothetical protein
MEFSRYTPPEYTQPVANPEQPHGEGTLETNNSGKIETRIDEEHREQKLKLLRILVTLELLRQLKFKEMIAVILSRSSK